MENPQELLKFTKFIGSILEFPAFSLPVMWICMVVIRELSLMTQSNINLQSMLSDQVELNPNQENLILSVVSTATISRYFN